MAAQLSLARRAGAKLIPSPATGLSKRGDNWEVTTENGETVLGKKVVLAQGTYTAINSLLAPLLPPFDLTLTAQTTALLEVNKSNIDLGCLLSITRLTKRRLTDYRQCQAWSSRSSYPFTSALTLIYNLMVEVGAVPEHHARNPLLICSPQSLVTFITVLSGRDILQCLLCSWSHPGTLTSCRQSSTQMGDIT